MIKDNAHVLIAEDDSFLSEVIASVLSRNGVRVTSAADGRQAIDAMEKELPTLLLLDLLMPHVDGYGVMAYIKDKKLNVPVVILSNLSRPGDSSKPLNAVAYLVKSDIDEDQIWPALEKFL